jgi:hypothetical protein
MKGIAFIPHRVILDSNTTLQKGTRKDGLDLNEK